MKSEESAGVSSAPPMVGAVGLGKKVSAVTADNENVYDAWAETYRADVRSWGYDAPDKAAKLMLEALSQSCREERLDVPKGEPLRIIDVGCGDGLFSESLASAPSLVATLSTVSTSSVSLTGVDVSSALLECARATRSYRELRRHDLNEPGALVNGFNEDTFDAAVCVGVLTYIDPSNVPDLLCQMACIVKPGGVVVYTCRTDMSAAWDARAAELEAQMMWEQTARLEEVPYLPNNPDYAGDIEMNICAYTVL